MSINKNKGIKLLSIIVAIVAILTTAVIIYLNQPKFGRSVRGERLERVQQSPNYRDGKFQNLEPTPHLTSEKSMVRAMFDYLFGKNDNVRPYATLPCVKTDLRALDTEQELLLWFGHSSYLILSAGERILIDPVFEDASPVSFFNKPFEGTDIYQADDMPDIDYLIITHDHWDHLDYETVSKLQDRVKTVICPLGVGEQFDYWGYKPEQIVEMDWSERYSADSNFTIHCLPTRHFSGRVSNSCLTLWAGYMVVTPSQTIYVSGDGGYGTHFAAIAHQFPDIDVAIVENGQYNDDWQHLHLMPEEMVRVVEQLHPKRVFTGHNGKYALSRHAWDEPLNGALKIPSASTPMIGEVVCLQDSIISRNSWWQLNSKL
ncbi:MAG: MBL fold metallo-hydrolase [Bacteroidales bacterium]